MRLDISQAETVSFTQSVSVQLPHINSRLMSSMGVEKLPGRGKASRNKCQENASQVMAASVGNQLQFHVWWLTATKWSMIDYNRFERGIKNLMRLFYKLLVLWINSCYLFLSNTSGHELLKYCVKLCFHFGKKGNFYIDDHKVFRFYLKECSLHIQLIVSFNFGLDHHFNCPNQLTFDYNRSSVHH